MEQATQQTRTRRAKAKAEEPKRKPMEQFIHDTYGDGEFPMPSTKRFVIAGVLAIAAEISVGYYAVAAVVSIAAAILSTSTFLAVCVALLGFFITWKLCGMAGHAVGYVVLSQTIEKPIATAKNFVSGLFKRREPVVVA